MTWTLYGLAALGVVFLLWRIYAIATPTPADLLPHTIDSGSDNERVPYLRALAHQVGSPVIPGNRIEPFANGDEIFPPMLSAIEAAEDSVHLLTYVYWTGGIARRFADALSAASKRGTAVRVIIDAFGGQRLERELVDQMREAGCEVAWFHPFKWYSLRRANHRTHRKVLVVDGTVGFTGGVGIADEWTGNAGDPDHWRDNHFRLHGPAVAWLQGAFSENWLNATGEVLAADGVFPILDEQGAASIVPLLTSPRGKMSAIALSYWLALQYASERVDIATPYFVPDVPLLEAMTATVERGVRVRLLVPNERNNHALVRYASLTQYRDLIEGNIELFEYQPTMMHTKLVVIDGRWSIVGSPNFDNRSFELNDEIALVIDEPALANRLHQRFEIDLESASRIDAGWLERRSILDRAVARAATLLRRQL